MSKESVNSAKSKGIEASPLAPLAFPEMHSVPGVELGAVAAGLRYKGRPDLLLMTFAENTVVTGVFTKSKTPGAPVDWTKNCLSETSGNVRAVVVNAGNANAFTGKHGLKATAKVASAVSKLLDCEENQVLQASTGVIGEPLDTNPMIRGLQMMTGGMSASMWKDSARAILTTDTFAKGASLTTTINGVRTVISGIAKGSGMIAPDMATMLGFVCTNANIAQDCLQQLLQDTTDNSFNAITVDSDTSTSDMVLLAATGQRAPYDQITDINDPALDNFKVALQQVMTDLAHQVIKDGEGATKFVQIDIEGAEDDQAAKIIARSVANSPLVKTAIAGEDPNWGRLIMAVGKSGEAVDRDSIKLWIGDQLVASDGAVTPLYVEAKAAEHMKGQNIHIKMHVGINHGAATMWTCDMTHGYISINADYRS